MHDTFDLNQVTERARLVFDHLPHKRTLSEHLVVASLSALPSEEEGGPGLAAQA
jgi:hypothetical protein